MIRKHAALPLMVLALVAVVGCRSAHVTSAILYIDQQMYQRAVDVLHEGLEYSPDEPEAFFYLGESHSHLAEEAVGENDYLAAKLNYEKAYDYYLKALALDPALSTRVQESLDYNYLQRSKDAAPFLLSLKAGGTGLNLTAAAHVVHFDRWWNPAVENQATDRAWRIGQHRNVLVHKFVCRGTIEERIDELIRSKQQLVQDVLDSGAEINLTEMSDAELLDLVKLDIHTLKE